MSPDHHDKRLPLRPFILGACFVWGTLCGFFFHVLRDPTPQVDPEKLTIEKTVEPETVATQPVEPPIESRIVAPPEDPIAGLSMEATATPESEKVPDLLAEPPIIPPLALNTRWGLTGQNAPRPTVTENRLQAPGPDIPPPPARTDWSPLDDPDIVF